MSDRYEHRFELEDGGYVLLRPNEINGGVMLQVGWQDEGMAEVALTPQEAVRVGPALVLTEHFIDTHRTREQPEQPIEPT